MESTTTGFSSYAGSTEGQTTGTTTTTSPAGSIETIRKPHLIKRAAAQELHSPRGLDTSAGQEAISPHAPRSSEGWTKQSYFSSGPLQAATSALLNDTAEHPDALFAAGFKLDKLWNGSGNEAELKNANSAIDGKFSNLNLQQQQAAAEFLQLQLDANKPGGANLHGGVVRLAPHMKLESGHELSLVASHQPVEGVIKTAPGKQHQAHDPHQHLSPKAEPMDLGVLSHGASVLQDLQTMRPSPFTSGPYDPYANGPAGVYGRIYDPNAGYPPFATLAGSQMQPQFLPPGAVAGYPINLSGPSGQEIYYSRPGDSGYSGGMRPPIYTTETPEEILARFNQQNQAPVSTYKPAQAEMVSPVDSGIGDIIVTPSKQDPSAESFNNYADLAGSMQSTSRRSTSVNDRSISSHRESPIRIPKLDNHLGFQFVLEAPISTSVRKDDDRMTYINKGQFYTVTMEYYPDHEKPLKSATVKSVLMIVFREEKPVEEELRLWQFWHTRQHSIKQRILDVDTKNSSGIVGNVEEIAHNGLQFCWNPLEQIVKINVAVHCLSTDFSTQKGVRGFPLHIQIDTFDDSESKVPFHRGYCQIKVFCDKGAERKLRDEEKKTQKRRLAIQQDQGRSVPGAAAGIVSIAMAEISRKKSDTEYQDPCDRSEFYHMMNLEKPTALFVPPENYERLATLESFYTGLPADGVPLSPDLIKLPPSPNVNGSSLEMHSPPTKRRKVYPRDRVMIYVRKPEEHVYTALHILPPSLDGLLVALSEKYGIEKEKVTGLFKQCRKGATVNVDDDLVKHYCNEDTYVLQLQNSDSGGIHVTLIELDVQSPSPTSSS